MPTLLNIPQTQLGPITEPAINIANAVKDGHGQILRTSPTAIFMYGLASGLIIMISIVGLLLVLFDRFFRKENVKTVKFGPRSPDLQGGDKFFLEQKKGMIYEGVVTTFNDSDYYEIRSDDAIDQELVTIPSPTLEEAKMEDDRKESKREMRKTEEEYEYQAFMDRFCMENFASFVGVDVDVDDDDDDDDEEEEEEEEEDGEDEDTTT
ncbi:hypothetical protein BCON_0199g00070 [Botryotinia convoluta]|uniref:Uncharacterized protein n=1 Tax=Botryotinia convoluta TaxID=54673 RepID=A0A4Z1HLY9_9HELO|nr:hypothetical protein BCON_0199g00070 [Botryotinia convoluta]